MSTYMVMVVVRHEYDDGDGCYSTFKCKINVDDGAIVTIMIVICVAIYLNHIYSFGASGQSLGIEGAAFEGNGRWESHIRRTRGDGLTSPCTCVITMAHPH